MNPVAGRGRAARTAAAVAQRIGAAATVEVHRANSAAGSSDILAALAGACDAVVVLGGDGIVHLAAQALALGETPLGIVAGGTGNDVADTLGLPADPIAGADAVVAALDAESVRRIDLGRIDGENPRWWVTVLCAGLDSAITETANRLRWPRGPRRYDLAIGLEFLRFAARPFEVELDGERFTGPATLVAVGNGPQYGGGKRMTHGATLDDGTFTVTRVAPVSRATFARLAPTLPRGGHLGHPAVTQHVAHRVVLHAPGTVAYADGERLGPLPLATECVPAALPVLVPPA